MPINPGRSLRLAMIPAVIGHNRAPLLRRLKRSLPPVALRGVSVMTSYRIKRFSALGSLEGQEIVLAEDDDQAIDRADSLGHPHELHVLRGDTLIARFDPAEIATL